MSTVPGASASLDSQAKQAREKLDAHVREVVAWHFDPKTGTPFWLERVKTLGFDPRKQVKSFDDLKIFGLFEDEWLRGGPVRRQGAYGIAGISRGLRLRNRRHDRHSPRATRSASRISAPTTRCSAKPCPKSISPRAANWLMLEAVGRP